MGFLKVEEYEGNSLVNSYEKETKNESKDQAGRKTTRRKNKKGKQSAQPERSDRVVSESGPSRTLTDDLSESGSTTP